MAMKLDHDDLDRLIEKISKSDIQEFLLEGEDFKLEIKRNVFDQNQVINISMKALEKHLENEALDEYNQNNESVGNSLGDILKEQIDK